MGFAFGNMSCLPKPLELLLALPAAASARVTVSRLCEEPPPLELSPIPSLFHKNRQ